MKTESSRRQFLTLSALAFLGSQIRTGQSAESGRQLRQLYVYVGSRTKGPGFGIGGGGGISVFTMNAKDGALTPVGRTGADFDNLNSDGLCVSADNRFLYAVNETLTLDGRAGAGGGVVAFAIDRNNGTLAHLNSQPSMGVNPCYIIVDPSGSRVIVANHGAEARIVQIAKRNGVPVIENPTDDGTVAMFPVRADGSLEPAADVAVFERRSLSEAGPGAAAHSVNFDRTGRFIVACDVGADHIYVYPFSRESRTLVGKSFSTPPGKAPRHSVFHSRAPYFFITNEREASVSSFHFDSDSGDVRPIQTVPTVASDYSGPQVSPSNIRIHPSGKFICAANRGDNSLAVFEIDEGTGRLSLVQIVKSGGANPREMFFDPSGRFLFVANVQSNQVVTFAMDAKGGKLTATGAIAEVPRPSCIHVAAP
jgi:6-phosphogluconolactonase